MLPLLFIGFAGCGIVWGGRALASCVPLKFVGWEAGAGRSLPQTEMLAAGRAFDALEVFRGAIIGYNPISRSG